MRIGIFMDLRNPPQWRRPWAEHYRAALELIVEAEALGADAVWFTEHHFFEDGYLPQPLTLAAAAAVRTSTVRLGTAVLLAALRPPVLVAEEAALTDLLSGGRLELGLGAGYRVPEFEAYGADLGRRWSLTDSAFAEIRRLLTEGGISPPPLQQPLPMWLGYQGPQGARRAGRLGAGLLTLNRGSLEPYREGLDEGGYDPAIARMGGVVDLVVTEDPERDAEQLAPYYAYQQNTYRRSRVQGTDTAPLPDLAAEELRAEFPATRSLGGLAVATPEEAVDILRARTADLPVQDVYLWASVAGMPDDLVTRHLELLFTRVRPALAERADSAPTSNPPGS